MGFYLLTYLKYLHRSQSTNNWAILVWGTTKSLNLIFSYLRNQTQSVRINTSYSSGRNIDLIGLFSECEDDKINSYVDDMTPYSCAEDMSSAIIKLQRIANKMFRWFENNHIKANPRKSHVLLISNIQREVPFHNEQITTSLWKTAWNIFWLRIKNALKHSLELIKLNMLFTVSPIQWA